MLFASVPTRKMLAGLELTGSLAAVQPAHAQTVQNLQFLGEALFNNRVDIPQRVDVGGTKVGGLSGITYDAANQRYYSISDDRSQINDARFYTLTVDFSGNTFNSSRVNFTGVTTLRRPDGSAFPALSIDPEGINVTPQGVYVSSEGDTSRGIQPFVNRFDLGTGIQNAALPVPSKYLVGNPASGVRNNLAFETLTRTPNGSIVTATENALVQDGAAAAVGVPTTSRILIYNPNGQPGAEYLYVADPVVDAPTPAGSFATNGLVDMLALSDTRFLALERSFSTGAGNNIRLYQVDLAGATDVSGLSSISGVNGLMTARKTLLLNFNDLGRELDNIEGLTFGPDLPNGQKSLLFVSDDNFSNTQFTQFLAFGVSVVPEPGSVALLVGMGVTSMGIMVRRRKK